MPFNASSGTRGARQPRSSPFANWVNARMVNRIRRRGGKIGGVNLLVLNTIGKKTGARRANPVGWFPAEDGGWMVVVSASPRFGQYEAKTDRLIPIVRLTRRG